MRILPSVFTRCASFIILTAGAHAATIPVTNTNNSGAGSLRQAITDSNTSAAVLDTITFNIPGSGLQTINLLSALPTATDPVIIDGYTQPGSAPNTQANGNNAVILVALNGSGAGSSSIGLALAGRACVVRGLIIRNFTNAGIRCDSSANLIEGCLISGNYTGVAGTPPRRGGIIVNNSQDNRIGGVTLAARNVISGNQDNGVVLYGGGATGNFVQGNFIGTNATGNSFFSPFRSQNGVMVADGSAGNTIGGTSPGARNVISGNDGVGIDLRGAVGGAPVRPNTNVVQGNYIGVDVNGIALPNGLSGIEFFQADTNLVGGTAPGSLNVISGNNGYGILISQTGNATGNIIRGNLIGVNAAGSGPMPNNLGGLSVGGSGTQIGGPDPGQGNAIAFNGADGVDIFGGTGNSVLGNSIHSNGSSEDHLGIDLRGINGVNANDAGDVDSGTNNLQNYPVITSVTSSANATTVAGTFNSTPGATFRLEFFVSDNVDPSNFGEGQNLVAATNVTTNVNGLATFSLNIPRLAPLQAVTATATDAAGNTSEFSRAGGMPPTIISPLNFLSTVGQRFVYQFEALGAESLAVNSLPPGLDFNENLRAIIGRPTTAGTSQIMLSASNQFGTTSATLVLNVQPAPGSGLKIENSSSATGRTGVSFSFQVITTGGTSAARLSATGLPPGLGFDPISGVISGTVTVDGSYGTTITVTDGPTTLSSTLQLTFTSDPAIPVIISPNNALVVPDQPFFYQIVAPAQTTPNDPTAFSLIGTPPSGIGLDADQGTISGLFGGNIVRAKSGAETDASGLQLSGGVISNVVLFASNSHGTGTIPFIFFLAPEGVANISTRLNIGTGDNVLIGGFIILGNAPKKLVIRALGPSLKNGNVPIPGTVQDPMLEVFDANQNSLGGNDEWRSFQEQEIINAGFAPEDNRESAVIATLNPGAYTTIVRGKNNTTGIGTVEVYDLGTASLEASSTAELANLSTRGLVQTGDNVMIGGVIIVGGATKVVGRAIGPSLTPLGVAGALQDTTLDLINANGDIIAANDDWRSTQQSEIIATNLQPSDDREACILATLQPGGYTAILRGKNATTGVATAEFYRVQPTPQ